jgi:hypothetical protein
MFRRKCSIIRGRVIHRLYTTACGSPLCPHKIRGSNADLLPNHAKSGTREGTFCSRFGAGSRDLSNKALATKQAMVQATDYTMAKRVPANWDQWSLDQLYWHFQQTAERERLRPTLEGESWIAEKEKERHKRLVQLERILLGLMVHGPSAIHEPDAARFIRWARDHWQDAYRQIRAAEREEYWRRQSAVNTPKVHKAGCACWDCLLGLHSEVATHQAEMQVRPPRRQPLTS